MAIAIRRAQTMWEGPLASGTGTVRTGSGPTGELPVTWAARTQRADGETSPEELAAAARSACYAMALALRLGEHKAIPERLAITELAAKVRRGARNAAVLPAAIAALSLALLGLGTVIATGHPAPAALRPTGPWSLARGPGRDQRH